MRGLFRRLWVRARHPQEQPLWQGGLWGWNSTGGGGGNTGPLNAPTINGGYFVKD